MMKRNGFREQFMALRPYNKIQLGLGLLFLTLLFVLGGHDAVNGGIMLANTPVLVKPAFSEDNLSGDELKMVQNLNKRFKELEAPIAPVDKAKTMEQIRSAFPGFFDETTGK